MVGRRHIYRVGGPYIPSVYYAPRDHPFLPKNGSQTRLFMPIFSQRMALRRASLCLIFPKNGSKTRLVVPYLTLGYTHHGAYLTLGYTHHGTPLTP